MKVLYSDLKNLIPDLNNSPEEVGNVFTIIGYMMDSIKQVEFRGNKDTLIGLEVRQNRPDCLSVYGLARELSSYYGLSLEVPSSREITNSSNPLNISIEDKANVKRVVAINMDNVKESESPTWLKEYLSFYEINSVNLLVDLSNYVMLLTGQPSHIFDRDKLNGNLEWSLNEGKFKSITTLDGSDIELDSDTLIVKDNDNLLALAGIVGGQKAKIENTTKNITIEMAVYERSIVRKNSRKLNIITEASRRLEKDLDPNNLDFAINLLVSLVEEYGKAEVSSQLFDFYEDKYIAPSIEVDLKKSSIFAGINISKDESIKILRNLGCEVKEKVDSIVNVTPGVNRLDLQLEEDIIEEIVRMVGIDKIPSNEVPSIEVINDITPSIVNLDEKIRDILSSRGFDEILSWPLTRDGDNTNTNYLPWEKITLQNSVNEEYPELRQSLAIGLINQLNEYEKNNLEHIQIFEIGKVYGINDGKHIEHESLALLSSKGSINDLKYNLEYTLRALGLSDVIFKKSKSIPESANKHSAYDVFIGDAYIGIIYKLFPRENKKSIYFSELILNAIDRLVAQSKNTSIREIEKKIIALDINVEINDNELIYNKINEIKAHIDKESIWSIEIIDVYPLDSKIRYTLRISYYGLTDVEAKEIHSKII